MTTKNKFPSLLEAMDKFESNPSNIGGWDCFNINEYTGEVTVTWIPPEMLQIKRSGKDRRK